MRSTRIRVIALVAAASVASACANPTNVVATVPNVPPVSNPLAGRTFGLPSAAATTAEPKDTAVIELKPRRGAIVALSLSDGGTYTCMNGLSPIVLPLSKESGVAQAVPYEGKTITVTWNGSVWEIRYAGLNAPWALTVNDNTIGVSVDSDAKRGREESDQPDMTLNPQDFPGGKVYRVEACMAA